MKDSAGRNELCGSGAKTKRYCGGYKGGLTFQLTSSIMEEK